jgi:hypothetical protein
MDRICNELIRAFKSGAWIVCLWLLSLAALPSAQAQQNVEIRNQDTPDGTGRNVSAPATLSTGFLSSLSPSPVISERHSTESSTEYRVLLDLSAASVEQAVSLGVAGARMGAQRYRIPENVFHALLEADLRPVLLGGETTYRFARAPVEKASQVREGEEPGPPFITKATGNFYISSGTVNDAIPDQGWASRWVQVGGGAGAPAGSATTNLQYRMRIHNDASPASIYCGDYRISLSSQAHGGAVPYLRIYDHLGTRTDDGFDDDPENDSDIYLNLRGTTAFNGEDPNQQWYVYVEDSFGSDTGFLGYIEFQVSWSSPAVDLQATDVYFRTQPNSGGTRVDNPTVGQQLYPYVAYNLNGSTSLNGTIWRIDFNGSAACSFSGALAPGSWIGYCNSPVTVSAGSQSLHGQLDPSSSFAESSESNNDVSRSYTVQSATDLQAVEMFFRTQSGNAGTRVDNPLPGQQVYPHFAFNVNSPAAVTGNPLWKIELNGTTLCNSSGSLNPGSWVGSCTSPVSLAAGLHSLHGQLDPGGGIGESNESNNDSFQNYNISGGGPDIRIEPLTVSFNQQATTPIYVELDWMADGTHSHKPSQAVIDRIVQTFAAAGYEIHIDVSNAVPHQATLAVTNTPSSSAAVQTIMSQNFNHAGDSRYYYSLWGHNYSYNGSFTTSSGIADLPGRVHLVTLGSFSGQTGTFNNQVGTFIHEFGHNLGQHHGGVDDGNYTPNYLSVMNYFYQLDGLGPSLLALGFANTASGFDDFSYSHGLLPSLNESNLAEGFGIGLGRAVDWNCNGTIQNGVAKDIQGSNPCTANGGQSVITDFDNWTSLASQIRIVHSGAEPPGRAVTCITEEEHRSLAQRIEALRAQGFLPPDGPGTEPPLEAAAGHSFLIYNDGGTALTVSSMSLDTATSWIHWAPQAPFTVAPGASQEVLVYADFGQAPAGQTTRRLLVQSNDPDESPYPGGVNLVISRTGSAACYSLTRSHTGSGSDPSASPGNSSGCASGQYHAGEAIALTASPASGWSVGSWSGTANNGSTSTGNSMTMPAANATVTVNYTQVPAGAILLVDDDDNTPDVRSFYTAALDALGRPYQVWNTNTSDVEPGATALQAYKTVIWFSGHEFGGTAGPGASGEADLATFLSGNTGRCLVLSSQDYFFDRGATSFMTNYLGLGSDGGDVEQGTVTGQGSAFAGMGPYALSFPFSNFSDLISPAPGAELAFSGDGGDAAISRIGPNHRTIFLGFPLEALPTPEARRDVLAASLDFCSTIFADVAPRYWARRWIEALFNAGVTSGCGSNPRVFCPAGAVTRDQMAVFLLVSKEGNGYTPPPCTTAPFGDVPVSSPFCPWIKELAARGVTSGCGGGNYCPHGGVTRAQMAVFLLATLQGTGWAPPPCTTPPFGDVPVSSPFCPWIKELAARGITSGCGGGNYCPGDPVNRAQMSVFLVSTFNLPLP